MITQPAGLGPIPPYLNKASKAEPEVAARFNQKPRCPSKFVSVRWEANLRVTFRIRSGEGNWDQMQHSDHTASPRNKMGPRSSWKPVHRPGSQSAGPLTRHRHGHD